MDWKEPKREVPTRWNSTYNMLTSLLAIRTAILEYQIRQKVANGLTNDDFDVMENLTKLLGPLASCTEVLQGDSYCSFIVAFGQVRRMRKALETMRDSEFKDTPYANLLDALLGDLFTTGRRLAQSDMGAWFLHVSALDPSFDQSLWSDEEKDACNRWLLEEYNAMLKTLEIRQPARNEFVIVNNLTTSFDLESFRIQESKNPNLSARDVFRFWTAKTTAVTMPVLSRVAARYLPIQASSASSERAFSVMNLSLRKHRNRLSPSRVEEIVMLAFNWDLLFPEEKKLDVNELLNLAENDEQLIGEPMSFGPEDEAQLDHSWKA